MLRHAGSNRSGRKSHPYFQYDMFWIPNARGSRIAHCRLGRSVPKLRPQREPFEHEDLPPRPRHNPGRCCVECFKSKIKCSGLNIDRGFSNIGTRRNSVGKAKFMSDNRRYGSERGD
jgi:hypothetical protein